jgi:cytochrome b561
MTTTPSRKSISATARNLIVDLAIVTGFLVSLQPHFTGMAIHEWLGVSLVGAFLLHILLHWRWLYATTSRLFSKLAWQSRINFILNLALLIAFTVIILSGILISEEALPFLGLASSRDRAWESLHKMSADVAIWIVGLHIALHWKWVLNAARKYLFGWLPRRKGWPLTEAKAL